MHSIALPRLTSRLALLLLVTAAANFQHAQSVDDRCTNATPIKMGETVSSSTVGQTIDDVLDFITCNEGGVFDSTSSGGWFKVLPIAAGTHKLHATTCHEESNSFDQRVSVFRVNNPDCSDRKCLKSGTEPSVDCPYSNSSFVDFETVPGEQYYIFVSDDGVVSGDFSLSIEDKTDPPENDSCYNTIVLEEESPKSGTTVGGTVHSDDMIVKCENSIDVDDDDDDQKYPGVWYTIPPGSSNSLITLIVCSEFLRMDASIFTPVNDSVESSLSSTICDNLVCQNNTTSLYNETCNVGEYSSRFEWTAEAGKEFFLYVHAYNDGDEDDNSPSSGTFQIIYSRNGGGVDPDGGGQSSAYSSASLRMVCWLLFGSVLFRQVF